MVLALGAVCVNRISMEIKNIVAKLKGDAVGIIAKQIADRVAGAVLK